MNLLASIADGWRTVCSAEFWRMLLSDDFNRGYFTALVLVICFLLLVLAVRIIFALIFRTRSCRAVTIEQEHGSFSVSAAAITGAAKQELEHIPGLEVRRIRLYRRSGKYILAIGCAFAAGTRCSEIALDIRPRLLEMFKEYFGIETIGEIRIAVEKISPGAGQKNDSGTDDSSVHFTGF